MAKSGNTQKLSKNLRIKLKLKLSLESSALKMKLKQVELSTLDMRLSDLLQFIYFYFQRGQNHHIGATIL